MSFFNKFFKSNITETKSVITDFIPNDGATMYHSPSGFVYLYANVSISEIIKNYTQIAPLNTGVNKLARAVANVPYALFDKETEEKIPKHPILNLLANPNMDTQKIYKDLARDFVIWRILDGNAYFIVTGMSKPLEIFVVSPQFITPQAGSSGFIDHFIFNTSAGKAIFFRRNSDDRYVKDDGTQELFVVSNFHPNANINQLTGLSEVQALYYEINQYLFSCQHNLSILGNGGRPSGAFVLKTQSGMPATLSEEQFKRLKQQIDEQYSGAVNAGKPLVLEGGLEWQETSINPKDMDFVKLKEHAEQKIYNALDIPISLIMDVKLTANNMQTVKLEFYQSRVIPLTEYFLSYMNLYVLSRYKGSENIQLAVDENKVDVLLPVIEMRRNVIEDSTVMMINEKRKALNLPPLDDGDVIVDPNGRHVAGPDALLTVGAAGVGGTNPQSVSDPKKPEESGV